MLTWNEVVYISRFSVGKSGALEDYKKEPLARLFDIAGIGRETQAA